MSKTPQQLLLENYLKTGKKASQWLVRSQSLCRSIKITDSLNDDEFDHLENLSSRFARLADILIQKIFRLIDQLLLESPGSIIDIINRAEKRGLCSAESMRTIRELRNGIADEYTQSELLQLFAAVQIKTLELLAVFNNTENYIKDKNLL